MSKWIVRVTVDGLAPSGVKASLGTMMISHTDACWLITRNGYIHIIKQRIYAHHIHVTVRWCYNAANFLTNPYNRHPIADREGSFVSLSLVYVPPDEVGGVITALDCSSSKFKSLYCYMKHQTAYNYKMHYIWNITLNGDSFNIHQQNNRQFI